MKSYRLHDSIYLAFWKRQNYSTENRAVVDRVRDGGGSDFKKLLCLWITVVVYESIHMLKFIKLYTKSRSMLLYFKKQRV